MKKLDISRRRIAGAIGASAALGAIAGCAAPEMRMVARPKTLGRVVIVGAGFGGATTAKYLKYWGGENIDVTLVDRLPEFVSCPFSNLVIGGHKTMANITTSYDGLRKLGVNVIVDEVRGINAAARRVTLARTSDLSYDRLVVSPGIDFLFAGIRGLDERAQIKIPHAWKAGQQTVDLRRMLEAMPDGGVYVLSIPLAPYRCPPGPYERISQVAHYFKTHKPRSKVIALDANPGITSKGPLFSKYWNDNYKGIIEYRPNSPVTAVDAESLTAITEFGDRVKAHVLNVVPQQTAGRIAHETGLVNANNRWCMVDWITLESTAHKNVHVLGDATLSAPGMPKSGHMANQHGKAAAAAIIEIMNGRAPIPPMMTNTCYSFVDDRNVIHVASVHRYDAEKKTIVAVPGAGGVSSAPNELEGTYANAWAQNIWRDMFA